MAYKQQWEGNKVIEDIVEDGVIPGILEASIWLQGELKKKISKPGKGRIYTKRIFGGSVRRYRASAPGDPPTVFEGNLRRSIQIDKSKLKGLKRPYVFVGTNLDYGYQLEENKNRPWMRPTFRKSQSGIFDRIMRRVTQAIDKRVSSIR